MYLLTLLLLVAIACSSVQAFVSSIVPTNILCATSSVTTALHAIGAAETEAERLLRKVKELRQQVKVGEDELHTTLITRKKTLDTATDTTIAYLFPIIAAVDGDGNDDGVCALCDRLRQKRLASDVLVRIVERLHEREVAARGLEHVAPSLDRDDHVTFVRVSQPNEVELGKIQGLVNRLIEAAEVLDREFIEQKSECNGVIVSYCRYHSFVDVLHMYESNLILTKPAHTFYVYIDPQRSHALGWWQYCGYSQR
jgi:hypothetical protein